MELIVMNNKEIDQINIFDNLKVKRLKQTEAAKMLNISTRQVKRKLKEYRKKGAASLVHGNRGKASNRSVDRKEANLAIQLIKVNYPDFGPTFASEKLLENHNLQIDHETLRRLMIKNGIWRAKTVKIVTKHFWRERKACFGEMVQLDGSPHHWFEDREVPCTLIAFIDDATSNILWLEFAESESTESLMRATRSYMEQFGAPASFYSDRGSVYKVNGGNSNEDRVTQYGRAMQELHVRLIHARTPQAKGRVENLFGTLQDRLVKELRLAGINSIKEANGYVQDKYIKTHNNKFSVKPRSTVNLHKTVISYDLDNIFCLKEERQVNNDWTINYKGRCLQLTEKQPTIIRPKTLVTVHEHLDHSMTIQVRGLKLNSIELDKHPEKIMVPKIIKERRLYIPPAHHPWRIPRGVLKSDISIELVR